MTKDDHDTPITADDLATSMKQGAKQFQRFKVIHAADRGYFERVVNEHLQAGWHLHGYPAYNLQVIRDTTMPGFEKATAPYTQALSRWNDEGLTAEDFLGPKMKP